MMKRFFCMLFILLSLFCAGCTDDHKPTIVLRAASIGNEMEDMIDGYNVITNSVQYFNRTNDVYCIELTDYDKLARYREDGTFILGDITDRRDAMFEEDILVGVRFDVYFMGNGYKNRAALEEKGLFADLTNFADRLDILSCVREVMKRSTRNAEGALYTIPFTVYLSTLITTTDILPKDEPLTYEKFFEIFADMKDGEFLSTEYMHRQMRDVAIGDFLDPEQKICSYDSPEFVRIAEFLSAYEADMQNRIAMTADDTVSAIIQEELSAAAGGVRSVAEACEMLQSRVNIYINE